MLTGRRADVLERARRRGRRPSRSRATSPSRRTSSGSPALAVSASVEVFVANAGLPATGRSWSPDAGADRPAARGQPARADRARAGAGAGDGRRRGRGHMVFVSSLAGKVSRGPPRRSTRRPSSGCAALRSPSARTCGRHGVGVSVVLPGFIRDAGMFADAARAEAAAGRRYPQPEEVAAAVIRLITSNRPEARGGALAHARGRFDRFRRARARRGLQPAVRGRPDRIRARGGSPKNTRRRAPAAASALRPRAHEGGDDGRVELGAGVVEQLA